MKIIIKKSEKSLIDEFIARLKKEILSKKKKKKRFSLVLTGGSSPIKLYKKLALSNIDWSYVDLFWGDERYVSQKSKNSNFKLALDTFIKKIKKSKKKIILINTNKNIKIK